MANPDIKLNLDSSENQILLNPRWPTEDFQLLHKLAQDSQEKLNLHAHVWVATSGSTASSIAGTKLVALSKQALKNSAAAVNLHLNAKDTDIWTQVLPTFHVGGLGIEVRAALVGARVVPALRNQRWDVDFFYEVVRREKCTLAALVPTQVYDLVSRGYKAPSSLRAVVIGGGVFEGELYTKARQLGWPVLPSYGMTETASQIATASLLSLQELEFPAMRLLSHAEACTTIEGFLKVKASSLLTCYAQIQNGEQHCWNPKLEGWFVTEDRGEVIENCLQILGRSKDYIKIGGEGTNVARLRSILDQCALELNPEWPLQVTLLDMPSARLGAEIHVASLLNPEETGHLVSLYSQRVLPFEKARHIHYLKEIPRSDLGKILWAELRRRL